MRRIFTLSLLPVFLFSIIGWQWMFLVQLNSFHENYELRIGKNLEIITVAKSNSFKTFFINDHELVHEGKLYDIKYSETTGDDMICYCERDNDEETLFSSFETHTRNCFDHTHSSGPKTQRVVKVSIFEMTAVQGIQVHEFGSCILLKSGYNILRPHDASDYFFVPPEAA